MADFTKFYKKTLQERLEVLSSLGNMDTLANHQTLSLDIADTIIENCIGLYGVPMGIAPDFVIDGQTYHAPMATEEPSVIAAATFGAKIIGKSGGFTVEHNSRGMIGQIVFVTNETDTQLAQLILDKKETLIEKANNAYPSIVKRGGGARNLSVEHKISQDDSTHFLIVYLHVDTQEAMGANLLNTMLEAIASDISELIGQKALLSILSNYATDSLVRVSCTVDPTHLMAPDNTLTNKELAERIVLAYQLASADVYRATTHNKGVMNGISAVVLATGNDTRAIEAGVHAYATHSGQYQPITRWEMTENHLLKGTIEVPLPIGFVGGSISVHPSAQIAQVISQAKDAKTLASLMASVGLAQNLAALRALVSTGIQKGHMALQLKSLALSVGATAQEAITLAELLKQEKTANQETAQKLLQTLRHPK
ncbi:hydroxymethylglutaryl-CoA reductase, degradative [Carnobacteriaceae bacterium zg-ZUI252]|nr:hydroxymethylglutaryl-CoA reductase, degradative [Carnobacteriaceae bacterium zg-ZUI252]